MKKKIVLSALALCSLFMVVGCGNSNSKYEKVMKEYATTFFNNHQKGSVNLTTSKVTIKELKEINSYNLSEKYDMSKLDKCTDESYVEFDIDANREIQNMTFHLSCGK